MFDNEEEEQEKSDEYCKGGYHCVRIGDTFCNNRYRVIRKLGWGAFSTVWLCLDIKCDDYVAIKIIKSKKSYRESAQEEIQMLSAVKSADPTDPSSHRLVSLYNNFVIKGANGRHHCLVFEVLGDSLFRFIVRSFDTGIPIEAVKRIIGQILEGLRYLHTKCHLIHTDIKPENILLTINKTKVKEIHSEVNYLIGKRNLPKSYVSSAVSEDNSDSVTNEVQNIENLFCFDENIETKSSDIFDEELNDLVIKIADLGNACPLSGPHSTTIQTRPYRSPEVILDMGYGPTADIWSTACTAFELATGQLLFTPQTKQKSHTNDKHLAQMISLLGRPPKVWTKGKNYRKFFDEKHRLLRYKVNERCNLCKLLVSKYGWTPTIAQGFSKFLLPMLEMDPKKRPSAEECLTHEWLNS